MSKKILPRFCNEKSCRGQTLVEYSLILALIFIAAILALGALGVNVTDKFDEILTTWSQAES